jgi:hypothetical protein
LGKGTTNGLAKNGYHIIAEMHSWEYLFRFKVALKNTDFEKILN